MEQENEETNDNILIFPRERIVHPENTPAGQDKVEQTVENIKLATRTLRNNNIGRVLEAIIPFIFSQLNAMGVRQDDDRIVKAGAFLLEALKALLSYHFGAEHKFHKLIEKTIVADNEGKLQIVGLDDEVAG